MIREQQPAISFFSIGMIGLGALSVLYRGLSLFDHGVIRRARTTTDNSRRITGKPKVSRELLGF